MGPRDEQATRDDAAGAPADDAGLWTRAAAGEEAARSELAALAQDIARGELRRRGARPADVADLVQETQRTMLGFLARNPLPPRDLRTFLKYRAWGVLSDHRKKMRATSVATREDLDQLVQDSADRPAAAWHTAGDGRPGRPGRAGIAWPAGDAQPAPPLAAGELARALAACRRKLPAELGQVLALRYDAEAATEAIQRKLGVHRNTIHVRVFRALERLRDCLRAKGFGPEDLA